MLPTLVLFGILPALVAAVVIALSAWAAARGPLVLQLPLAAAAVALAGWGLLVVLRMLMGAWPTVLPYYAIASSVAFLAVQWVVQHRHHRRALQR